jgi:hypothetical protein
MGYIGTYEAHAIDAVGKAQNLIINDMKVYLEGNSPDALLNIHNVLEFTILKDIDMLEKIEKGTQLIEKATGKDITQEEADRLKLDIEDNAIINYRIKVHLNRIAEKSKDNSKLIEELAPREIIEISPKKEEEKIV